jgi:hypothetical protein
VIRFGSLLDGNAGGGESTRRIDARYADYFAGANNSDGRYVAHQMSAFALSTVNRSYGRRCPMIDVSVAVGLWIPLVAHLTHGADEDRLALR